LNLNFTFTFRSTHVTSTTTGISCIYVPGRKSEIGATTVNFVYLLDNT